MSATPSIRGFTDFEDLCKGCNGYSYNLAELFDRCDHDHTNHHRHSISFNQSLKRLKLKLKQSLSELERQTERKVTDFTIGKSFVKEKKLAHFNPMKPTTWCLGGGITARWRNYKSNNYDGLIVLGCVERNLVPKKLRECSANAHRMDKTTIEMNQQNYALGLEQALIQYFSLIKADERLRNLSFDIGNISKEKYMGGVVYVAYKLEPEPCYSDEEDVAYVYQEPVPVLTSLAPTASHQQPLPSKKYKNDVKDRKEKAKKNQTKASDVTFNDNIMTTKDRKENTEKFKKMEHHSITQTKTNKKPDKPKAVQRNKECPPKEKGNTLGEIQSKDKKERKRRYDINNENKESRTQEKKKKKDQIQKPNDERTKKDAIVRRKEQITEEKKKNTHHVKKHNDEITKSNQIRSLEINFEMKEKWKLEEKKRTEKRFN